MGSTSHIDLEQVEHELQGLIGGTTLPPYVSRPFNHQIAGYMNDALFVDHMLRLSKAALTPLQVRHQQLKSGTDLSSYFEICLDVVQLAGLRKIPIRWLIDPQAAATARWPSINYFDIT